MLGDFIVVFLYMRINLITYIRILLPSTVNERKRLGIEDYEGGGLAQI